MRAWTRLQGLGHSHEGLGTPTWLSHPIKLGQAHKDKVSKDFQQEVFADANDLV